MCIINFIKLCMSCTKILIYNIQRLFRRNRNITRGEINALFLICVYIYICI